MTTTIKSTELDFQTIKENLKTYLKTTGEFNDYDFEGSGISSVLDVLAYNTHYNALQTNFALNESFLVTAQLRPSVISLSESLGYIPDSKKSAEMSIAFSVNAVGIPALDENYTIQPGQLICRGSRDDIDYTFSNRLALKATRSNGIYTFFPVAAPDNPIVIHEGDNRTLQFIVGNSSDAVYVLPDQEIDIATAIIKVFEDQSSAITDGGEFSLYTNLLDASTVSSASRLYVLRESPNAYYEVSFGNGTSLGVAPTGGQVVEVDYLRTSGDLANGISSVEVISDVILGSVAISSNNVSVSVIQRAAGGGEKEDIESIRKNAPYQFAAQNRMVTSDDYSTLILKKYSTFITDIQSWGGEDNPEPDYGTVFTSIVWKENLNATAISNTRQGIISLADQFQIASFSLTFTDPIVTYISTEVFFQFNPALSGASPSSIRAGVDQSIADYFIENTGKFGQVFRQSNLLTEIDATDPSVLSSRVNIIVNRRVVPQLATTRNYTVSFPTPIRDAQQSTSASVYTSQFSYENQTVTIRNKLDQRTQVSGAGVTPVIFEIQATSTLEMIDTEGVVILDNVGSYDKLTGNVTITALTVQSVPNSVNYIKVFAVPANQSVINSVRNNIVKYDADQSFTQAVIVDTR
jgi:hypothetical protein